MSRLTRVLIEAMAKHLPPSASELKLLDVNGAAGDILTGLRADLVITNVTSDPTAWSITPSTFDAVTVYDGDMNDDLLHAALTALRPGGRLIAVESRGEAGETRVKTLEDAGYTRILVETAIECPLPTGVLLRGEKPHTTDDTAARVQSVAVQDADTQPLADFKGRYLHLLVAQTPNKPVWSLDADEALQWQAVTVDNHLLAFSSLPKAVNFMQPAVLSRMIQGVNKVAKFSRDAAAMWELPVRFNPVYETLTSRVVAFTPIDPATAEASDE